MPAFGQALWAGFDAGKLPRPEYVIPVLFSESGLNPAATNSIGCVGINQLCPFAWPIPVGYASWSASQQLAGPVTSMFGQLIAKYGPINSGTRVYIGNFLPADLPKATSLDYVLATRGGAVYSANSGLDYTGKGTITVADMAHFVSKAAGNSYVKSVIAQTYALRPGESPEDPVYGTDFGAKKFPLSHVALIAAGAASAALLGWLAWKEYREPGYLIGSRA